MENKDGKNNKPAVPSADSVGMIQKRSVPRVIFGMLCRYAVALCGALGVCLMLEDGMRFLNVYYEPAPVILICLIFTSLWFLLFVSANTNIVFFCGTATAYIAALVYLIVRNGLVRSFIYLPVTAWNHILMRLESLGYVSFSGLAALYPECDPALPAGRQTAYAAFIVFAAVASFVFVACTFKRVRVVPVIITAGTVMTITFTYNILTSNFGLLLTVCSGFALLFLKYYAAFLKTKAQQKKIDEEKREKKRKKEKKSLKQVYKEKRESLKKASIPGFPAFLSALLIFTVAVIPAAKISSPSPEFGLLNDIMDSARTVLSAYLTGTTDRVASDPDVRQKSTEPTRRDYGESRVMTVRANSPAPVYLRSWVADKYRSNQWVSSDAVSAYITGEQITELFYSVVDGTVNEFAGMDSADPSTANRGFIKDFIRIKSVALKSRIGYTPSRFSRIYGITGYNDMYTEYDRAHYYMPGPDTVEMSMNGAQYGAAAYLPDYRRVSLSRLDADMTVYNIVMPRLKDCVGYRRANRDKYPDAQKAYISDQIAAAEQEASGIGVKIPSGSLLYAVPDLDLGSIDELYQLIYNMEIYESYVYNNCTFVPWSEAGALGRAVSAADISRNSTGKLSDAYTAADKTARYLARNCTYTLEPEGYNNYDSYITQFLETAKNGYCVQYATAGALILRAAGFPARYVDGYLAQEMKPVIGGYECEVKDKEAHAWIEVYVRGYGWLPFEMTGPMIGNMYSERTPVVVPDPPETVTTDITTYPSDTTAPAPDTTDNVTTVDTRPVPGTTDNVTTDRGQGHGKDVLKIILISGAVLLAVLLVSTAVYLYLKKTSMRRRKLDKAVKRAAEGGSKSPEKDINVLTKYIFLLLSLCDIKRGDVELMTEFADRVDKATKGMSFAKAAEAIQKNAFGHCADEEDAKNVGEYAAFIRGYVRERLTGFKKFYYVTLRKLL